MFGAFCQGYSPHRCVQASSQFFFLFLLFYYFSRLQERNPVVNDLRLLLGCKDSICFVEWGLELLPYPSQLCIRIEDDEADNIIAKGTSASLSLRAFSAPDLHGDNVSETQIRSVHECC